MDELEIALDNATQIPDGNTAGDYPVDVTVTYPDGSEDKVQVTVTVKEQKDNEKYIPNSIRLIKTTAKQQRKRRSKVR
ncbi:Rib/alpha-like domain-containing protein [[Ruminococcus] torques]|nr:Rib/alpha-like domain-containing protein [[Ruminococcus] torques]